MSPRPFLVPIAAIGALAALVLPPRILRAQAVAPAPASPAADTGSLAGTVRDAAGRPIAGAHVRDQASGRTALANVEGTFRLDGLPAGARAVEFTAIGYVMANGVVEVRAGQRAEVAVTLAPVAGMSEGTRLDSVRVTARGRTLGPRDFEERRRVGLALRSFTAEDIERHRPVYVTSLLATVPGVRISGTGPRAVVVPGRGASGPCARVYIDGYPMRPDEVNSVSPTALSGIEYYDVATAPVEYLRGGACGVILLWTKHDADQRPPTR